MEFNYDQGIARVPKIIAALGLLGAGTAGRVGGWKYAVAFLLGSAAAYFNFRLIERAVNKLGRLANAPGAKQPKAPGLWLFIQFAAFVLAAFVILRISGFSAAVAMWGFLVCPAAVMLEILYELITYDS